MGKTNSEKIEALLKDFDSNTSASAVETINKIKSILSISCAPNFDSMKQGEHFTYSGFDFVYVGKEQNGALCVLSSIWKTAKFSEKNKNDYRCSDVRKLLNTEFLDKLNKDDLLMYTINLIADNGETDYGTCQDYVGLISCDTFRKYRNFIPSHTEGWVWTCTPYACSYLASFVRGVSTDGSLNNGCALTSYGIVPACIFKIQNR